MNAVHHQDEEGQGSTSELSLCYANRSAALFRLSRYEVGIFVSIFNFSGILAGVCLTCTVNFCFCRFGETADISI